MKHIKDPIYGYAIIPRRLMEWVDKPEFQATRRVRQLGFASHIFPSAEHSRFSHMIGTCHLGGVLLDKIAVQQPEIRVPAADRESILLALLMHDIGHLAYSHLFDHNVAPELKLPVEMATHEARGVQLIRWMHAHYRLSWTPEQIRLTCALIMGTHLPEYPPWYFGIVANHETGFDLDKLDYLQRDWWACGLGTGRELEVDRIMHNMRIVDGVMVFHQRVAQDIYDVYNRRVSGHIKIYRHRVSLAYDILATPMLLAVARAEGWRDMITAPMTSGAWSLWRLHIADDALHRIPVLAARNPDDAELQRAVELYRRYTSREHPRVAESTREAKSVIITVGFTGDPDLNPFEKIKCFESFSEPRRQKPLLECGISSISSTHPSERRSVSVGAL